VLSYDRNPAVSFSASPLALLRRWADVRPTTDAFFPLAQEDNLSSTAATHAVLTMISALRLSAPVGCTYSSNSARIGTYNEWLSLSFLTPWIMHLMGWESEGMLRVYFDPRITVTDDSGCFFGHMRPQV
jgi:hypothetical protein